MMTVLAWITGAAIVGHNVVVFYYQSKYNGELPFNKAWLKYMRKDILGEGRESFLVPTLTFVLTFTLCATMLIMMLSTNMS
jgi:hypothetical protein